MWPWSKKKAKEPEVPTTEKEQSEEEDVDVLQVIADSKRTLADKMDKLKQAFDGLQDEIHQITEMGKDDDREA